MGKSVSDRDKSEVKKPLNTANKAPAKTTGTEEQLDITKLKEMRMSELTQMAK